MGPNDYRRLNHNKVCRKVEQARMIPSHYPKVAIVSCTPLCGDRSNGILMSSLFRGWPRQQLSQIYFRQLVKHRPHFDVCDDFSAIELSGRVRHSIDLQNPLGITETKISSVSPTLIRRAMQVPKIKGGMKFLQECWQGHSWIGHSLSLELQSRQPDAVYALLGNYGLTRIITDICRRLAIPYFIHIFRDLNSRIEIRLFFFVSMFLNTKSNRYALRFLAL